MPSRAKKVAEKTARLPSVPKELISLFMTGAMMGGSVNEATQSFKKAPIEASLEAELTHHLGY